jgi:hypothetical protein
MSAVCVVCKLDEKEAGDGLWTSTCERTSISQAQVIFKLFDVLKLEFQYGSVCSQCYDLLEQIDSLELQHKTLCNALRERVDQFECYEHKDDIDLSAGEPKHKKARIIDVKDERVAGGDDTTEFWQNAHDPFAIEAYLNSNRLDSNLTMATTQRGEDQLIFRGHIFKKKVYSPTTLKDGRGIFKWRCSKYYHRLQSCRGQVATTMDGLCVLLASQTEHNHPPDPEGVKTILFRERLKEIALNHPDMKTSEILASAEMLAEGRTNLGLKDESLHRYIQRIRAKKGKPGDTVCVHS